MTKTTAREQVGFLPLLAGNLVMVAVLVVPLCAMFNSAEPLWLLQAPYFSVGAILVLVLLPLELWILQRARTRAHGPMQEWLLAAAASALLGVPGALLIFLAGALVPTSAPDPNLAGLWGYAIIGGFSVSLGAFICTLGGRVIAEVTARFRPLAYVVFAGVVVQFSLTVVFIANRMA